MAKHNKKKPKKRKKPAWMALLPGGKVRPTMTLEQLRNVKNLHGLLTETIPGPPAIGYAIRSFRFLEMYAMACILEKKFPPLTRCWNELERLFLRDAAFRDNNFVATWIFVDFPCSPDGRTVLDHFEGFLVETEHGERFQPFIDALRGTRLGLYQEVARSSTRVTYRELFTERAIETIPSIGSDGPGEIVLGRIVELGGDTLFWGDVKAFPAVARTSIEDMISSKFVYVEDQVLASRGPYETFMKLAGPYWMSVVATNDNLPILDPDHYLSYLEPN